MALKMGEAVWSNLPKQEGEPVKIEIPKNLPKLELNEPKIVTSEQQMQMFGQIPSFYTFLNDDKTWGIGVNSPQKLCNPDLFEEENIEETPDGLYINKRYGKERVTNFTMKLMAIKEIWHAENEMEEEEICRLSSPEAWGDISKEIKVKKKKFKNMSEYINQTYPELFVSSKYKDVTDRYSTLVYQRDAHTVPRIVESTFIGWVKVHDRFEYRIGIDNFYKEYSFPNIDNYHRGVVFEEGFGFREVGHLNEAIEILWLFAHTPYTMFWQRRGNVDFRSVLFLKGKTNTLKTSTTAVVSNVFCTNRQKAAMRLSSTRSSLQDYIEHLKDNLVCLDDFSNTAGGNNANMIQNAEFIIRANGDGIFPAKMSVKDFSQIRNGMVRCGIVMTGEEEFGLGLSSLYRLITVSVDEGTFDGNELLKYQRAPEILRLYFSLYIKFLSETGYLIIDNADRIFQGYRKEYEQLLQTPRYIDAAAGLRLQLDILLDFAQYCGVNENFIADYYERASNAILTIMRANQNTSKVAKIEVRFLTALMQSIGTTKFNGLADDEEVYAANESNYVGFEDKIKRHIWIRFEEAFSMVEKYYYRQGQTWTTKPNTIKEELLIKGISVGKLVEGSAGSEYLCRAKKGSRKRMLVLKKDMIEKILNESEVL